MAVLSGEATEAIYEIPRWITLQKYQAGVDVIHFSQRIVRLLLPISQI